MLLAIDAGNTDTVFALFEGDDAIAQWRISSNPRRTADEYAVLLTSLSQSRDIDFFVTINAVVIASVVPQNLFELKKFCRAYCSVEPLVIGESELNIPLRIELEKPSEVGADRLVNAIAAYDKFKSASIVIDFGTATTFDVISTEGSYLGGLIAPGINLSLDALHQAAAKLPEITIKKPDMVIGKSTVSAMQSGVYWGYIGLVEGIVGRIKDEYGSDMTTVATGGLSKLFSQATDIIEYNDPELTIRGLNLIYKEHIKNNG